MANAGNLQDLTILAEGLAFPEGPVVLADGNVALVEIARGRLTRIAQDGTKSSLVETGGGPNGLAQGPDGAIYICNNGGLAWRETAHGLLPDHFVDPATHEPGRIERFDPNTGALKVLYTGTNEGPLNGPNDIVFDAHGGFWFTDLGTYWPEHMCWGAVYYAHADGSGIERAIHPMITPNGIGLSPAGDQLYVAESRTARVWGFDIAAPGRIAPAPWPSPNGGTLLYSAPSYQVYDSLSVEAGGNICVATMVEGGILVISPNGGLVEFVPMPEPYPTNICFSGTDMTTAYVTLSGTGRLACLTWPRPGLALNC